jgi:AAA15 family ATPase/GTPase
MKLISFSISNFRSFLSEQSVNFDIDDTNVDIFVGPNNSGKSNILQAMAVFKSFIQSSTSFQSPRELLTPFAFNDEAENMPTTLSAEMQLDKFIYFYSFSIQNSKVTSEVLKRCKFNSKKSYETLFSRLSMDKNRYEEFGFDSKILRSTREDSLVLTKAFENNNKYALDVFHWLDHFLFVSGSLEQNSTAKRISEDDEFKTKVLDLLRRADLSIQDLSSTKVNVPDDIFDQLPIYKSVKSKFDRTAWDVRTTHMVYDSSGKVVRTRTMPIGTESMGTRRIFELASPILDSLEKGNILYIDEFETHLHPRECEFLVELFTSKDNSSNAQLILNTHNAQLLDHVGRDSIHLVGKNNREETVFGRISKNIRTNDKLLEKKYTKGMFGAVPNIQW